MPSRSLHARAQEVTAQLRCWGMDGVGEPGPLQSLGRAIAERGGADTQLTEAAANKEGGAVRIAASRRRPLVLRFAGGTDSLALMDLSEAVCAPAPGRGSAVV
jgi:hypothetical protein